MNITQYGDFPQYSKRFYIMIFIIFYCCQIAKVRELSANNNILIIN